MDLLSPAAMATARRNLSQRIERLLKKADAAPWQLDQMLRAIDAMEEERFADGERTMMKAERPDLWEPKDYLPSNRKDGGHVIERLKRSLGD